MFVFLVSMEWLPATELAMTPGEIELMGTPETPFLLSGSYICVAAREFVTGGHDDCK
jgi:hypothetical protein